MAEDTEHKQQPSPLTEEEVEALSERFTASWERADSTHAASEGSEAVRPGATTGPVKLKRTMLGLPPFAPEAPWVDIEVTPASSPDAAEMVEIEVEPVPRQKTLLGIQAPDPMLVKKVAESFVTPGPFAPEPASPSPAVASPTSPAQQSQSDIASGELVVDTEWPEQPAPSPLPAPTAALSVPTPSSPGAESAPVPSTPLGPSSQGPGLFGWGETNATPKRQSTPPAIGREPSVPPTSVRPAVESKATRAPAQAASPAPRVAVTPPSVAAEPAGTSTPEPVAVLTPAAPVAPKPVAVLTPEPVAPKPVAILTPEPVAPVAPKPVAVLTPEPVAPVAPKPVAVLTPEPVAPVAPKPVAVLTPEPVAPVAPKPVAVLTPEPVAPVAPKPVAVLTPEPVAAREPVAVPTPSPRVVTARMPAVAAIAPTEPTKSPFTDDPTLPTGVAPTKPPPSSPVQTYAPPVAPPPAGSSPTNEKTIVIEDDSPLTPEDEALVVAARLAQRADTLPPQRPRLDIEIPPEFQRRSGRAGLWVTAVLSVLIVGGAVFALTGGGAEPPLPSQDPSTAVKAVTPEPALTEKVTPVEQEPVAELEASSADPSPTPSDATPAGAAAPLAAQTPPKPKKLVPLAPKKPTTTPKPVIAAPSKTTKLKKTTKPTSKTIVRDAPF